MCFRTRRCCNKAQLAFQFKGVDSVLALGHKLDFQELDGERQFGVGEERAARQRVLATAVVALVSAVREHTKLRTFVDRALEPIRPAPLEKEVPTLFFRYILPVEFGET
ncbi:hypothetical protein Y981_08615 [Leptospirillum ferriphilum YSK]|uniref:Uncharacterized protein n=1 Tax=Leptospirillum ferriphilum YSK TaxID=1441628 RepID=A0A059XXK6_9BACT|nr:hypothetical protein Y981_08615 [Leptospirillum ferriphilum YSK]